MEKYSFELKMKIVRAYLSGEGGYKKLALKYKISGKQAQVQVHKWVNAYREFGEEGLLRKRKNKKYTVKVKENAVELYLTTEMSTREIANKLGINNPSLISNWIYKFRENGVQGLSNKRGSPSIKKIKQEVKSPTVTDIPTSTKKLLEVQERKIRALEIEVAYLKELRRLRNAQLPRNNEHISIFIHNLRGTYQLTEILEALDFPKSTYMYWTKRFSRCNPDEELEVIIIEICAKHKAYGYRRVTMELKRRGHEVNKKKVQRLMKKLKLNVTCYTHKSRKYNSYKGTVESTLINNLNLFLELEIIINE